MPPVLSFQSADGDSLQPRKRRRRPFGRLILERRVLGIPAQTEKPAIGGLFGW